MFGEDTLFFFDFLTLIRKIEIIVKLARVSLYAFSRAFCELSEDEFCAHA